MASSSLFSTWTINGSVLAPKASKSSVDFPCSNLNNNLRPTDNFLPIYASADWARLRAFPNVKAFDWRQENPSLRSGVECRALKVETKPLFSLGSKFQLEDVIEAQQFDRDTLSAIFDVAIEMEKIEKNSSGSNLLKGYLMATLFYEPSTRTRLSFESAMKRLGGEVLTTENAREFSSAAKGETLEGSQSCLFILSIYEDMMIIIMYIDLQTP